MEIEKFAFVFEAVAALVVDDPKHSQNNGSEKENGWENNDEDVLAPWTALPGRLIILIVASERKEFILIICVFVE